MDHAPDCPCQRPNGRAAIAPGPDASCVDRVNRAEVSWWPRGLRCTFTPDAASDPVVVSDAAVLGGTLPGASLRTLVTLRALSSQARRVDGAISTSSARCARPSRADSHASHVYRSARELGKNSLTLIEGF